MTTTEILLGIIALAVLVMAIIQVGLIVVVVRLARRMEELGTQFQQDVRPVLSQAQSIASDAARATALALAQVERADRVFGDLARRVDDTSIVLQNAILAPARQGRALLAGVVAALGALREAAIDRRARAAAMDDDDPLFIG